MTKWQAFTGWWRRRWQWVVAGVSLVFGVVAAVALRRPRKRALSVDPIAGEAIEAALPSLRDIGPQAEKIKDAIHADATTDAKEAKDAHAEIDAADSIDAVNAVLYGTKKPG